MKEIPFADVLAALALLGIDKQDSETVRGVFISPREVTVTRHHLDADGHAHTDNDRIVLTEEVLTIDYLDVPGLRE